MTETGLARVPNGFDMALRPSTVDEAQRLAVTLSKSKLIPTEYANRPEDIMIACSMGAQFGLNPFASLAGIKVINGKATLYGDQFAAVAMAHPEYCGERVETTGSIEAGDFAVRFVTMRKRGGVVSEYVGEFSIAHAKRAKLWGKQGPWSNHPDRQTYVRARGFSYRNAFPDAYCGVIPAEEADDYEPIVAESRIKPVKSKLIEAAPVDVVTGEIIESPADAVQSEAPAETPDNPTTEANVQPEATEREISVAEVQSVLREYTQEQVKELPTFSREATWEQVQAFVGRQFASPRDLTQAERLAVVARFGGAV